MEGVEAGAMRGGGLGAALGGRSGRRVEAGQATGPRGWAIGRSEPGDGRKRPVWHHVGAG
jgi:hypothetical protein